MNKPIKVIITGATGMVGAGVLQVSLSHPGVEKVLLLNRRPCGVKHSKLAEIIYPDFFNLSPVKNELAGYDACFFCLGISSVGMSNDDYYKTTHTLTIGFANVLKQINGDMTFCYISGAGTSETSRQNWAKVKAKTEHDLMSIFPGNAYGLRPGFIKPLKGQPNIQSLYKYIGWLFPIGRRLFPGGFCTMQELALCMIHIAEHGYSKKIISGKEIIAIASHNQE